MKTCSYCGRKYPDDAKVCSADGEPLPGTIETRRKVTGVWRGLFGYPAKYQEKGFKPVAFTLKLKQGWFSSFEGTVTEDPPQGFPGNGAVNGYYGAPSIEFTKQMPVGYLRGEDGVLVSYREYLRMQELPCEQDLPAAPVFFQGRLLDADRAQGIWTIEPTQCPMLLKMGVPITRISGFWCAQFVADDLKANPVGGPSEPLFDKSLLSPSELEEAEEVSLVSLGKFTLPDVQVLTQRFIQASIHFQLRSDRELMQQATPIEEFTGAYAGTGQTMEIFVHPGEQAAALAIIQPHDQG
jgi:hypothetical protein